MGTLVNPADSLEEREKLLRAVASIKKLAECLEMTRTASELGKTLNDPDKLQNTDIRKQLDALAGFCGFLWSMCPRHLKHQLFLLDKAAWASHHAAFSSYNAADVALTEAIEYANQNLKANTGMNCDGCWIGSQ